MRDFVCPFCGAYVMASKVHGVTPAGHVKTMWCWRCLAIRDFVQIGGLADGEQDGEKEE